MLSFAHSIRFYIFASIYWLLFDYAAIADAIIIFIYLLLLLLFSAYYIFIIFFYAFGAMFRLLRLFWCFYTFHCYSPLRWLLCHYYIIHYAIIFLRLLTPLLLYYFAIFADIDAWYDYFRHAAILILIIIIIDYYAIIISLLLYYFDIDWFLLALFIIDYFIWCRLFFIIHSLYYITLFIITLF